MTNFFYGFEGTNLTDIDQPTNIKDQLDVSIESITRSKANKLKEALNKFVLPYLGQD